MRLPPPLLALTPGTLQRSPGGSFEPLLAVMERALSAAVEAGVSGFLVREPHLEDGAFLELLLRFRGRLDQAVLGGTLEASWLGVHDRLHLAAVAGCDGAHVGSSSLLPAAARKVVGPIALGGSSHRGDDPADFEPVDYLLHAPTFPPSSKPSQGAEPLGWDGVRTTGASATVPVWALGGITAERLGALAGGAQGGRDPASNLRGVALIGGLWGTGPEPIDGAGFGGARPLEDVASIASRAGELVGHVRALWPGVVRG